MASNRWVAIDPDILIHPLVGAGQPVSPADPKRGAYSRTEAWLWIICNASFADHTINNRGRLMTLQRGDLLGAWAFLAHTFNWSAMQVRRWVETLIADNMLHRRAVEAQAANGAGKKDDAADVDGEHFYGNAATILSVVNYWRYQFEQEPEMAPSSTYKNDNQSDNQTDNQINPLSAGKLAEKYVLQQQQRQPIRQPNRQHITITTTTVTDNLRPLSERCSDEKTAEEGLEQVLRDALAEPEAPKTKRQRKPRSPAEYTEQFETFWAAYPDRTNNSKLRASEEWEKLSEPEQNAVIASLPSFGSYCRKNPEYRCVHAERYLSQRRWESHAPTPAAAPPWWQNPELVKKVTPDRWRAAIKTHANGTWPVGMLGPAPGDPQCRVPHELIDELRLTERYDHNGIARTRR